MSQLIKKLIMPLVIAIVIFAVAITVVIIFNNTKKLDYKNLENKMREAAIAYMNNNKSLLPVNHNEKELISYDTLRENGYIDTISEMLGKEVVCNAWVDVVNNHGNYLYVPMLMCGNEYSTESLSTKLTTKTVTSGDGLYKMGDKYVYRGEIVKNYVQFAERLWRILSIDSEGNMKLLRDEVDVARVWDDRYNVDLEGDYGVNDYKRSRIREYLDHQFNEAGYFTEEEKTIIINSDLCIGGRKGSSTDNSGKLECAEKFENQPMGLIQLNEYMNASLEKTCTSPAKEQCKNYNYLAKSNGNWWTITKDTDTTNSIYLIRDDGKILFGDANYEFLVRPTIVISKYVSLVSGSGSQEDPYIIK